MPTLEEIKELAEQYAEFTDGSPADKAYIRAITQCFAEWLCKTHCIVPKSKLKEEYEIAEKVQYSSNPEDKMIGKFVQTLILRLFGTELFNEKKE